MGECEVPLAQISCSSPIVHCRFVVFDVGSGLICPINQYPYFLVVSSPVVNSILVIRS